MILAEGFGSLLKGLSPLLDVAALNASDSLSLTRSTLSANTGLNSEALNAGKCTGSKLSGSVGPGPLGCTKEVYVATAQCL